MRRAASPFPARAGEAGQPARPQFGALVVSLDFELHWGVRDLPGANGWYRRNLLGVRRAVPRILELFAEFGVSATWATVGFLFARSRGEQERFWPALRPAYRDPGLSPYGERVGEGEHDDPLHFAPSLIEAIRACPRQEIGTHTFSHYYCLEAGQTRETFGADLDSAAAIAAERGMRLRSIVFPRNQHNPGYDGVLLERGIVCYRGNPQGSLHRALGAARESRRVRAARLVDAFVDMAGPCTTPWDRVLEPSGLCNVPASRFLRPCVPGAGPLDALRLRRIGDAMRHAARAGEIFHLWWHPHNFGAYVDQNVALLRRVLEIFDGLRRTCGMRSMSMEEVAMQVTPAAGRGLEALSRRGTA
ncbi:MAG TPA: hypothetical protein VGX50_03015 [Longimicrobium sp.]|nr:hypothetical protein [Longimicrobium sp.]